MPRLCTAALLLAITLPAPLAAQQPAPESRPGRLVGRVTDAATGEAIPGAHVGVEGTAVASRTDLTGRYTLLGLAPGTYTITVRVIGYAAKAVTGVAVGAQAATALDVTLIAAAIQVAGVEVTAAVERGSVTHTIDAQRAATQIVSAVSQEQIRRSPDSDAGQVVQRVSGVTVQDGKYVFVRGLGERYTTTSLNNARIPSPEPERKVVPLDLFPAGLLQSIVTSKTFTPEQPGDFSGAQVDLRTREFPAARVLSLSTSTGLNDAATFRRVLAAPRLGSEWLGFAGAERALPAAAFAAGNLANQSQTQLNEIVASFRNVWSPWIERAKPNGSFGVSFGGEDLVGGRPLGYVGSLTYSESQEIRHREARATTRSDGTVLDSSSGSTGTLSVLWGGLLNLTARLGDASTVSLSNTYTRSADNQATRHLAYDEEHSPTWGLFDATRLTMIERSMRSHQLRGEHLLAGRHGWTWSATASTVRRYEPDRSDLRYETDTAGGAATPTAWFGQVRSAVRTFSDLVEDAWEGASALSFQLGAAPRPWRLKVGGTYRSTTRDADTRAFDISNRGLTDPQRRRTPELVFSAPNALDSAFILAADAVVGRYGARDHLLAGYAQVEMPLSARVQIIGGARVERWALDMTTTVSPRPITRRNTDLLPALTVNVKVNTAHALRLSASQTLARPEYRELSPTGYRDFIGGFDVYGNDTLRRTLIRNYDARWEWYPNPGEILSLGVFAKDFDGPIEKVITGSTGADALTFVNASGGRSYGLELELRKNLLTLIPALAPFSVFANATFMHSRIEPGSANLTNAARPMVGQAPYVVNLGLTYTAPTGVLSATALYNVVGRRVHEAGSNPRPDAYEEARNLVDVSIQAQLWSSLTVKLDGKNLLDDPMHVTQGAVTRLRYTTGRVFSLGLTWQP